MKLLIASDIHGAANWCERVLAAYRDLQADRLVLLGDILYHGPRNDLPADYAPKRVIELLNPLADHIIAVRGNCEAEVDQMVLQFPCMASYNLLVDEGLGDAVSALRHTLFFTHGHEYGAGFHNSVDRMPNLALPATIVYGHTHIKVNQEIPGYPGLRAFNPGSVGIPKDGSHSFGFYESGRFQHGVFSAEGKGYELLSEESHFEL